MYFMLETAVKLMADIIPLSIFDFSSVRKTIHLGPFLSSQ